MASARARRVRQRDAHRPARRGRDPRHRRPAGRDLPALARQAPGAAPAAAGLRPRRPFAGGRHALPDTGLPDTPEPRGSFIAFQLAATVTGYPVVLVFCPRARRAASETVLPHDAAIERASTAGAGTRGARTSRLTEKSEASARQRRSTRGGGILALINMLLETEVGTMAVRKAPPIAQPQVEACCAPIAAERLSMADAERMSRKFAALADPVRLRILSMLATAEDGAVCEYDLVEPIGRSQPTISHHLKALKEAGLVTAQRDGKNTWYTVVPAALDALREVLSVRGT